MSSTSTSITECTTHMALAMKLQNTVPKELVSGGFSEDEELAGGVRNL